MFVEPGVLNGTPAVTTTLSSRVANPSAKATRVAETTASLKRSTSSVIAQWRPQTNARRRAVPRNGVSAMIGTVGRSRAAKRAVVPEWVKQQIALISVVSATSRAAAVIAVAIDGSAGLRPRATLTSL